MKNKQVKIKQVKKKQALKKNKIIILIALAILLLCSFYGIRYLYDYFLPNSNKETTIYIYPTDSYKEVLTQLKSSVTNYNSFLRTASKEGLDSTFRPGRYTIRPRYTNRQIIRNIKFGWQTPIMLTLSGNIRNVEKLSSILGKKLAYDSLEYVNTFNNPNTWDSLGLTKETFPTLFIPNTYEVYWTISPEQLIKRMKKENDAFWSLERLEKANELGLSKEQISTLASIICEESNYTKEYPRIAGVYINRLKRGMKLGADPTVKFAIGDPTIKRILFSHLTIDSPYNTYKYEGLPPGPITIPTIAAIDAVLNYEKHNYLYFCADPSFNGRHRFATSLSEHNKNARAYQSALSNIKR
jgi:conserved hypothetical protein, YceG family